MSIFSNDFWHEVPTFTTHAPLAAKNFKPDFSKISRLKSRDMRKIHFGYFEKI